jgi:hypothetical protein
LPLPPGQAWGPNGMCGITNLFFNCIEYYVKTCGTENQLHAMCRYCVGEFGRIDCPLNERRVFLNYAIKS